MLGEQLVFFCRYIAESAEIRFSQSTHLIFRLKMSGGVVYILVGFYGFA